jgi:hypothetical protein
MGKRTSMETLVKYSSGNEIKLAPRCDLCSNPAVILLSTTKRVGEGLFLLTSNSICETHAELVSRVITGEISAAEQLNYEHATKRIINLRG